MTRLILFLSIFISNCIAGLEPVIIVLGPPGSGKGNFSQFLKENYNYNHLGAGDLLRQEINQKTSLGLQIEDVVKNGDYIDTQIMHYLMTKAVSELQKMGRPFTIDGFGGNEHDMEFLQQLLSEHLLLTHTFVFFLDADDAVCKKRMSNRLICRQCEQIYNADSIIPEREGRCDHCSGELFRRNNDKLEIIEKRLRLYRESVEGNYRKALKFFPCLFFRADADLNLCADYYRNLAIQIDQFQGNAKEFIDRNLVN